MDEVTDAAVAAAGMHIDVRAHSATDVGLVRSVNEDSFLVSPPIFIVADGMGGHQHGDRASRECVEAFASLAGPGATTIDQVLDAIQRANVRVLNIAADDFAGTTLTGVALVDPGNGVGLMWMVFNVGDSRVYAIDELGVEQVSVDHSAVQELIDAGAITELEALTHPERNVVTAAIGNPEVEPDVWLLPVTGRQRFLICSDGLTKELDHEQIVSIIHGGAPDENLATTLVSRVLTGNATDNVTVIVIDAISRFDDTEAIPAHLEQTFPRVRSRS